MTYGYFDDANREYVITNPCTPAKWINYIGTLEFGGYVDQTGGALICAGDPALNRIVKYIPQLPNCEPKGETLYLRIKRGDAYQVLSPFYTPTLNPYDRFECHVGLGYQRIVSEMEGLRIEVTIFIPRDARVELRDIRVENISGEVLEVDLVPFVEYTHFEALKQFTNADWVPQTMMSEAVHEAGGGLLLKQFPFMRKKTLINYFTSNAPVDSFESDRARFLGNNEYATWQNPATLQKDSFSNYEARRGDNIAALLHKLGTLQPGEAKRIITQLGQVPAHEVGGNVAFYRDEANVDKALEKLATFWSDYLNVFQCETPSESMNSTVNVHNPRQCYTTLNWSRYLSLYQLGLGARGIGFRDSTQDIMGALSGAPKEAKNLLRKLISVQKADGSAMHQFFPLTMEANEGDSREDGEKLVYGDDHLWAVLSTCAYIKETGDYAFLDEEITYYDKNIPLTEREAGTVLEHLKRGLAYTKANVGQHGLPLLGFADWNDTVNLPGEAESMFVACLYGVVLKEMIELSEYFGDEAEATRYRADHAEMAECFNREAWDGEWYQRYFTADGTPLGSKENDEGKIFTNGQSWPIMAGFAPHDRATSALNSVFKYLNTANGIKLSWPGYTEYDHKKGGVTTYPPGAKENGGIFVHSNPWVMIAETMMGHGDRAFQYYTQINPAAKNDCIDTYEIEPYVYAQNILGDEHPQFGLGRNSWLSGTASWTYQAATQYILGVRPTHQGLMIDPCTPKEWDGFTVTRQFRGATYRIRVENPGQVSKGVTRIIVDGRPITGQVLAIAPEGTTVEVEVVMGASNEAVTLESADMVETFASLA